MTRRTDHYRYEGNFPGSELSAAEWEFLKAMERYQRAHRRRYPTWSEVLLVVESLGYRKVAAPHPPARPAEDTP
jgi:hypothetical protein